jgi:Ssl1-like
MLDRDMRPTRLDLMLEYVREFVGEWFDQNPLGQIGVVGMRVGIGERICDMSGWQVLFHKREYANENLHQEILRMCSDQSRRDTNWSHLANLASKTP